MDDVVAFTRRDLSELTGLSERRLRGWQQAGIFLPCLPGREPEPNELPNRFYSFRDLVALRLITQLLARGVPLRELGELQPSLLRHDQTPWARLRLRLTDGHRPRLVDEEQVLEPGTGGEEIEIAPIAATARKDVERRRARRPEDIGRLTRRPGVQGGATVLADTRIPTWSVSQMHDEGYDLRAILRQYSELSEEDVRAAIAHEQALQHEGAA